MRNIPSAILEAFVSGTACRSNEQSVSDILRNLGNTHDFCNTTFFV